MADRYLQAVVLAVVSATVAGRPVLLTAGEKVGADAMEHQIRGVVNQIFGVHPAIVACTSSMDLLQFLDAIPVPTEPVVLFWDVHRLAADEQTGLVELLRNRKLHLNDHEWSLGDATVLCTGKRSGLSSLLRDVIWCDMELDMAPEISLFPTLRDSVGSDYLFSLRPLLAQVTITAEVRRYMNDIVIFLRTHRLVRRGVSPRAVKDLELFVRVASVFQTRNYATPSTVDLAVRKIMPLKLTLCRPEDEPSLQYGGQLETVRVWMKQWGVHGLIDTVLADVPSPL